MGVSSIILLLNPILKDKIQYFSQVKTGLQSFDRIMLPQCFINGHKNSL